MRHATADWTETEDNDENTEDEEEGDGDEDEEDEEENEEDGDEDGDEDTPLLPIFSAAHLGKKDLLEPISCHFYMLTSPRCASCIQSHACHPSHRPPQNRNHLDLGPTPIATSLPVSSQTDATTGSNESLFAGDVIRFDGKLFTIPEGRPNKSWKCWSQ